MAALMKFLRLMKGYSEVDRRRRGDIETEKGIMSLKPKE
jgi:hypothetical protein